MSKESGGILLTELKITDFAQELGAKKSTPGGGSTSALAGALASCLVKMVANLSDEDYEQLISQAEELRDQLLQFVNEDTQAFNAVQAAFRMPKGTEDEKVSRRQAIQDSFKVAAEVPLKIMEASIQVLELGAEMAVHGNQNCVSDAGVAGLLSAVACKGGAYNVMINLPYIKDADFVAEKKARVRELLQEADRLEGIISDHVTKTLDWASLK